MQPPIHLLPLILADDGASPSCHGVGGRVYPGQITDPRHIQTHIQFRIMHAFEL